MVRSRWWNWAFHLHNLRLQKLAILTIDLWHSYWFVIFWRFRKYKVLGLVPLNPIVWCYVLYYLWHYVWHDVWLNIVINKVVLLSSEIMVTWIFKHYHIVHEMHSMWFMWFSHRRYKSQVRCKLRIWFVVGDEIGHFICII